MILTWINQKQVLFMERIKDIIINLFRLRAIAVEEFLQVGNDLEKRCRFENHLYWTMIKLFGSGALSGKILLVRTVVKNKIDTYFRAG